MEQLIKHNENLISIKSNFNRFFFYQLISKYRFNNYFSYLYSSYNEYLYSKEYNNYMNLNEEEQFICLNKYNQSIIADILEASFHNYQFFKIVLSETNLEYERIKSIKVSNNSLNFQKNISFFFYKSVENDVLWILKDKNTHFPENLGDIR